MNKDVYALFTDRRLASYKVCLCFIVLSITARVHNKGKEREYPILTIPFTNAPRKACTINHQGLSFCINTFRATKDLMIGVNSFVVLYV